MFNLFKKKSYFMKFLEAQRDDEIYYSDVEDLPKKYYKLVFNHDLTKKSSLVCKPDLYTPLKLGKEWLYELTREYQPKTGKFLTEGSELIIIESSNQYFSVQMVEGTFLTIKRNFHEHNLSDENFKPSIIMYPRYIELKKKNPIYKILGDSDMRFALPDEILKAYYTRFDSFKASRFNSSNGTWNYSSIYSFLFLSDSSNWYSIRRFLKDNRLEKTYLPWIKEYFPGKLSLHPNEVSIEKEKDWDYSTLRIILDTRVDKSKKEGDVLIIKTYIQDKIIYHVKDMDFPNMRILSSYQEAIDNYNYHTFLDNKRIIEELSCGKIINYRKRFDFLPYTTKFIDPRTQHPKELYDITEDEINWWRSR